MMPDIVPSARPPGDIERVINRWLIAPTSGSTNQTYLAALRRINVATWRMPSLTADEAMLVIKKIYADGYSDATVALTVAAMSSLWNKLIKEGIVRENPWAGQKVRTPKDKTAERVLTRRELEDLIAAAEAHNHRDAVYIRFLYYSTLRVEESVSVRWREIRPDETGEWFFVTVRGKGDKTRTVKIPLHLVQQMVRLYGPANIEPDDLVWPFKRQWGYRIVRRAGELAGLGKNVSPHWLRHTGATDALEAGANIRVVQESLGHTSLLTTQKYTHVYPEDRIAGYLPKI